MDQQKKEMKVVYTVVEGTGGKSWWTRVGVAFVNRDGSWNLKLDAIPTNGTLQVRDREFDDRQTSQDNGLGARRNGPAKQPDLPEALA
jgi:hypothetical protein